MLFSYFKKPYANAKSLRLCIIVYRYIFKRRTIEEVYFYFLKNFKL